MAKKVSPQQQGELNGIKNMAESDPSTLQLIQMQDEAFGEKPAPKEKEETTKETEPKEPKSRAEQIIEQVQNTEIPDDENEDGFEEEPKDPPTEPTGRKDDKTQGFIPTLEFTKDKGRKTEVQNPPADPDIDKETNLKNLRKIANGFKAEREQLKADLKALQEKSSSADVVGLQTQISNLETRIRQLEPYESVFALHENPTFKAKFLDGDASLVADMRKITDSYDVDETVLEQFLLAENRKAENEILSEVIRDSDARSDLRALKAKRDKLLGERKEYEKKPAETLRRYREAEAADKAVRNQRRNAAIDDLINTGWGMATRTAAELGEGKRIQELTEIPGQKDHNEKVVRPTLAAARQEYIPIVSFIEKLVQNQALPDEGFVHRIATLCQQAHAARMLSHSREAIYQELLEARAKLEDYEKGSRPPVRTSGRTEAVANGDRSISTAAKIFMDVKAETEGKGDSV